MEINLVPRGATVTFRERSLLVLKPKPWLNTELLETHADMHKNMNTHKEPKACKENTK